MRSTYFQLIFLLSAVSAAQGTLVGTLFSQIQDGQYNDSKGFQPGIPPSWAQVSGLYDSAVHLNFVGNPVLKAMRQFLQVPDNNMFTTAFVVEALLEAALTGSSNFTMTTEVYHSLSAALKAMSTYNNLNPGGDNSQKVFWAERLNKDNVYETFPPNLDGVLSEEQQYAGYFKVVLKALGLEWVWNMLEPIFKAAPKFQRVFHIAADSDDSAANLAIGALLRQLQRASSAGTREHTLTSSLLAQWKSTNQDIATKLAEGLVKYSYRPFDNSSAGADYLDPRTYYVMRQFLAEYLDTTPEEQSKLKFITTWLMSQETQQLTYQSNYSMPESVNNVDVSAAANAIYSFALQAVVDAEEGTHSSWMSDDFADLLNCSTKYLKWAINTEAVFHRPDIAMLYYPPIYNMYWFCSRTLRVLEDAVSASLTLHPVWSDIMSDLQTALRGEATRQILHSVTVPSNTSEVFWYDFLGANDSSPGYNDRVYTTSVAINFLLNTWTQPVAGNPKKLQWVPGVPCDVVDSVDLAMTFLRNNAIAAHTPDPWMAMQRLQELTAEGLPAAEVPQEADALANSFFSGSIKGFPSVWLFFPANVYRYLNGTALPEHPKDSDVNSHTLIAMKGVVSIDEYVRLLDDPKFGISVPPFKGFNAEGSVFPYWTSYSVTRAFSLLSLVKFEVLEPNTSCQGVFFSSN